MTRHATIHDSSTWATPPKKRWVLRYLEDNKQRYRSFDERADAEHYQAVAEGRLAADPKQACAYCAGELPDGRWRYCSDDHRRRWIKADRKTETADVGKFVLGMIRSLARRVGGSDIGQLGALWEVQAAAEQAVTDAITDLRSAGFTWEALGDELGISRQAVQQWHRRRASSQSDVNGSLRPGTPGQQGVRT